MESLPRLVKCAGQNGLQVNVMKTKFTSINKTTPCTLSIARKTIQIVEMFSYIGSILAGDGVTYNDVQSRIQKACQALIWLYDIWNSSQLTKNLRL